MVFSSLLFLFFYLPVTLAVYYLCPSRWRNLWLFIVNLVFYGWGEPVYVLLMVLSIAVNYAAGFLVEKHRERGRRILSLNAVVNLGLLFFFKYYDFLALNLSGIGAMGMGGDTTVLAVNIEYAGTHRPWMPVAVNINCWPGRVATCRVYPDGRVETV